MDIFLAIILLAILIWLVPIYYHRWRRHRLRARPLGAKQIRLLEENLPLYRHLPPERQAELQANMSLFLHDKEFVGCNGLQVTEPMRICVAGFACLLLLGRENRCYPYLRTVLLYPGTYVARETYVENHIETTAHSAREGKAHYRGPVVLSWGDLEQDMQHPEEGRNVVLHEFAHKLDEEDGSYDGRPVFASAGEGKNWAPVLKREFELLRQKRDHWGEDEDSPPVLDFYGAESPAEFFAVITESFFVTPAAMRAAHPELYRELCALYRIDPCDLLGETPPADRH
ncbi:MULTISPECIES: zinc-dependent peptidase [unclassified Microbulbifer]|uniref:M90 family metallopeptidase n=1 Tax=unclassified Microbulbifer TaxID=2619833 RepID=UPI0027E48780|nr:MULTISPECIES: zinc-dependent peptidase [unclassified Microbulbifer]